MDAPARIDDYLPIGDYGVIGNERTAALVGRDGSIDFLCLPRFDSEGVFAALLDPARGGSFTMAPTVPYESSHRYLPGTNVLETTFETADGTVRVIDALSIPLTGPPKWEELIRKVEPVSGRVPMRWALRPRFGWGSRRGSVERRAGAWAVRDGELSLTIRGWGTGEPTTGDGDVESGFVAEKGASPLVVMGIHEDQPWLLSEREDVENRLEETCEYWRRWLQAGRYEGPWKEAVDRSALALAMLVHAPSGSMMAAVTTSLPEAIGGGRNFDYRYCWMRDTAYSLEAIQRFGRVDQVHATLTWLLRTIDATNPNLKPFYGIDGSPHNDQHELGLAGYRGSQPVRSGNNAESQLQLGNYGDLFEASAMFVEGGHSLGPAAAGRLERTVEYLTEVWGRPDASIWELSDSKLYTQGKLGAWVAFDRAVRLAERGELGPKPERLAGWRRARDAAADYLDERCWSESRRTYTRAADDESELDAAALMMAKTGFWEGRADRLRGTVAAVDAELGAGSGLLYRYSGQQDAEGAFVACSFWMIEALAALGETERAAERMDEMVGHTSELGLLSEEIDPGTGELLGNLPQALSHLALINAAFTIERGEQADS